MAERHTSRKIFDKKQLAEYLNGSVVNRELEDDLQRLQSKTQEIKEMLEKMDDSMYPDIEEDDENEEETYQ